MTKIMITESEYACRL